MDAILTTATNTPRYELGIDRVQYSNPIAPVKRTITISQPDFGFIVQVGCQTIAIESKEKLLKNLKAYLDDPAAFEKAWDKNKKLS